MTRRRWRFSAFVLLLATVLAVSPAIALDEPERLWMVGKQGFEDGLYPLARRALERFTERYPRDPNLGPALLMLGRARLALGDYEPALDAFQKAAQLTPPPGQGLEARFWEAEALFRLKRFSEARAAYDAVLTNDAAAPFAPDAFYGDAWAELELKRPEPAITAFRQLLQAWPDHALAPSASYYLARTLVETKRASEAIPLLADFKTKYPTAKLVPDAQYLLGIARVESGDRRQGLADLKAFVEAYPNDSHVAEAKKQLTHQVVRTGSKAELQVAYTTLMTQSPRTADGLAEAMTIATRLGRPKDRDTAWRKLRTEFPDDPVTHRVALAQARDAFEKKKDWQDAAAYGEVAARSGEDGDRSEALLIVGESNLKLKRYAAAAKAFEAVGGIESVSASDRYRALAGLGLAREELKEFRAALVAYESVAAKSPDATLRDWAKQRASVVRDRANRPSSKPAPSGKPGSKSATKSKGKS